jgi:hypothetical protein
MAQILEEDVHSSVDCVVYLCNKLHINQPGTACHSKWETLKTTALQALFDSTLRTTVDKLIAESTGLLAAELAARVTWPIAQVYVFLFVVQLTATVVLQGDQLHSSSVLRYIESADVIASVCPTEKYLASIEKTRHLLMRILEGSITADELSELATTTVWQTRYFIYHFQPDTLPSVRLSEIATSPLPLMSQLLGAVNGTSTVEQGVFHGLADSDTFKGLKDTIMSMKEVVAAYPFRIFLKVMNRVAMNDLARPDGATDSLNQHDMNICAVYVDTELAHQLFSQMGYVFRPEIELFQHDWVMFSIANNRVSLQAFHEIAEEELRATICPGIEQFTGLDNVPLLVAHLTYNLHFRMTLLTYCTPTASLDLLEEDIYTGMDCVEYLALRLNFMQSRDFRSSWYTAKQIIKKYVSSRGQNRGSSLSELDTVYCEVSQQIQSELTLRVSRQLVALFTYAYLVQQISRVCIRGEMLTTETLFIYLDICDAMHLDCMSERWRDTIETTRRLLLNSFDKALSKDEILKVAGMAVWQSRNFIYHFKHEAINSEQCVQGQLLPMRLRTVQRREDGTFEVMDEADRGGNDQETDEPGLLPQALDLDEKPDGYEKMDKEKDIHKASNDSANDTDVIVKQACTDMESLSCVPSSSSTVECQENGLLYESQARLAVLQQEVDELQKALLVFNEARATSAALSDAIREKKAEIDIVQRFVIELETMHRTTPGKVSVSGLGSLPQVCLQKMLRDIVHGGPCPKRLVCQIIHLISSAEMAEICRRLGLVGVCKTMEIVRERLTIK